MYTRFLCLFLGLWTCMGTYGGEPVTYVLATMDDVAQGGDFIMASSADLAKAYVAKEYDSQTRQILTTQNVSEYGVLNIKAKSGSYQLSLNGVVLGVKNESNTDLWEKDKWDVADDGKWKIEYKEEIDGFFIYNCREKDAESPRRLQFRGDVVKNYTPKVDTNGYSGAVYLFKAVAAPVEEHSFRISESGFTTLYVPHAFRMPAGATGGIVTEEIESLNAGAEPSYRLTYDWRYNSGDAVPASTPLIIKGEEGNYPYQEETCTDEAPTGNLLHGTLDADGRTAYGPEDQYYYYKLSYKSADDRTIGFWWGAADGGPFLCAEGKAYLTILRSRVSQVRGFSLGGNATGIASAEWQNPVQADVYGTDGRLVRKADRTGALPPLAPGVYIVAGRKVWLNK